VDIGGHLQERFSEITIPQESERTCVAWKGRRFRKGSSSTTTKDPALGSCDHPTEDTGDQSLSECFGSYP